MTTQTSQHTPGPWIWMSDGQPIDVMTFKSPGYFDNPVLRGSDNTHVIGCGGEYMPYGNPANARLIAAAPEMADALLAMMQAADELMTEYVSKKRAADWGVINDAMVKAGKLLARIEGKE